MEQMQDDLYKVNKTMEGCRAEMEKILDKHKCQSYDYSVTTHK